MAGATREDRAKGSAFRFQSHRLWNVFEKLVSCSRIGVSSPSNQEYHYVDGTGGSRDVALPSLLGIQVLGFVCQDKC